MKLSKIRFFSSRSQTWNMISAMGCACSLSRDSHFWGTWACVLLLRGRLTLGGGGSVKLQFEKFYRKEKSHPVGGILEDPVNIAFQSGGAQSSLKGRAGRDLVERRLAGGRPGAGQSRHRAHTASCVRTALASALPLRLPWPVARGR